MTDSRTHSTLSSVAAATAAVYVAGHRAGSAVLVDRHRLLTAGHVLRNAGMAASVPSAGVEVVFPAAPGSDGATRIPARQVNLGIDGATVDMAVLDLISGPRPAAGLPAPVPLSPLQRLPSRVSVFGFPHGEKALRGVWRDFETAGPAADGTVQLDWADKAGTLPGHSGGPVIDPVTGVLVGVLVQGSQAGQFDRFLPLSAIRRSWPGLPRPGLLAGADARSHFTRRSRGQRGHYRGGDLFRGRETALATVSDWLTAPQGQGRPLVVTGQPGAGKSAVVARAALSLEQGLAGPGLAFHARGAVYDDLLAAVADLIAVEQARTCETLLDALEDTLPGEPVMIVVDALDEAASGPERWQIAETLAELAAVPQVRMVVATRPLTAGNRFGFGELLPALGITSATSSALVDLDTDRYFERSGLHQFAAAVLTQDQAPHPHPADAAWAANRADTALRDRLADVIATRANRNYLVAAMAAIPLSTAEHPVDPAVVGFDPTRIASGVGEALAKYLDQLPEPQQSRTRALLTALAYARGSGIDDRTLIAFTEALRYPIAVPDLDQLRASTGADYLLQTITEGGSEPLTRLFHQALADELLARRHQPSDERALLTALAPRPGTTWATASAYALTYAADHASGARLLPSLLNHFDYLIHGDLTRLATLLGLDAATAADPIAGIVRRAVSHASRLPPDRRARLLALTAAHFGLPDAKDRLAALCHQPFTPRWAHSVGHPHLELAGHTNNVDAVAIGRAAGRDIIVSASRDQTVRVWDAATGQPYGEPLTGHTDIVTAVAIGRVAGQEIIVSASWDRTVRMWDAATGQPYGEPLTGHTDIVTAVAIGRVAGQEIIASASKDRTVRMWDAATGQPYGEPLTGHTDIVMAVAIGRDIIVSASRDQTVRMWDAATGQPYGEPLTGHTEMVMAVAVGGVGGRDIIVSASWDRTVRMWDAATGQPYGEPLTGHTDIVTAVAIGQVGGREIIASASGDQTVRVWDAATRQATPFVCSTCDKKTPSSVSLVAQ
jgi:V8-like Glu-specific endopeptidase